MRAVKMMATEGTPWWHVISLPMGMGVPVGETYVLGADPGIGQNLCKAIQLRWEKRRFHFRATVNLASDGTPDPVPYVYDVPTGHSFNGSEYLIPASPALPGGFEIDQAPSPQVVRWLGGVGGALSFSRDSGNIYLGGWEFFIAMGYATTDPHAPGADTGSGAYVNHYTTDLAQAIALSEITNNPSFPDWPLSNGSYTQAGTFTIQCIGEDGSNLAFTTPIYGVTGPSTGEGDNHGNPLDCNAWIEPPGANDFYEYANGAGAVWERNYGTLLIDPVPMGMP